MTLAEFLLAAHTRPFVWGECDCALWTCDWIKERRGIDPGAPFRRSYETARQCHRLLRGQGGLLRLASRVFSETGLMAIEPMQEIAGDVACVDASFGQTLGIVTAPGRVAMKSKSGIIVSALHPILRAWRV